MKNGMKFIIVAVLVGIILLAGCKKQSSPIPTPANPVSQTQPAVPAAPTASAAVEQTTCPIRGEAIDKNVFVEYQGKKVYFCCKACIAEFEKAPEKYLSKLPQFAK
ncbi:MAG: YHS domain-containing protein [Phycisphaerae bacterium]|jgi:YHS domain-containing protein